MGGKRGRGQCRPRGTDRLRRATADAYILMRSLRIHWFRCTYPCGRRSTVNNKNIAVRQTPTAAVGLTQTCPPRWELLTSFFGAVPESEEWRPDSAAHGPLDSCTGLNLASCQCNSTTFPSLLAPFLQPDASPNPMFDC